MKATIAGAPDTIAAKVKQLADMGINHLHLRFLGEWDGETRHICKTSAELFATEVMPRFAEAQSLVAARFGGSALEFAPPVALRYRFGRNSSV